jgi:uncharacterized protein (DUF362 family)/NAD-dependent dihydropyrimidine dehydrogenase PreA subunit
LKTRVTVVDARSYDPSELEGAIEKALEPLGTLSSFIKPGMNVLVKPNLLVAAKPSAAVTTNPALVRAVIRLVKKVGGVPQVGDSPALHTTLRALDKTGILKAAEDENALVARFEEKRKVRVAPPSRFREFDLAREGVEADAIINLPKAKTHGYMGLTLAVKNMFGLIVGTEKAQWHLKAADDPDLFAAMLVTLVKALPPTLSILDAVVGMEGNGPRSGTPRNIGFLAASADAVALDVVVSKLLGFDENSVRTLRAARLENVGVFDPNDIDFFDMRSRKGEVIRLRPAVSSDFSASVPTFLKKILKSAFLPFPLIHARLCTGCGTCVRSCPAEAIDFAGTRIPSINGDRCIRCFCCQETCPSKAITIRSSFASRLARIFKPAP